MSITNIDLQCEFPGHNTAPNHGPSPAEAQFKMNKPNRLII